MDDVKALGNADSFGALSPVFMKVSLDLGRVWWQLDSLTLQTENVALNFSIVVFGYFG